MRQRADYFSGNNENRKSESTRSLSPAVSGAVLKEKNPSGSGPETAERSTREAAVVGLFSLVFPSCISVPRVTQSKTPHGSTCGLDAISKSPLKKGLGLKETCVCRGHDLVSAPLLGSGFPHQVSPHWPAVWPEQSPAAPPAQPQSLSGGALGAPRRA